ncbi:MAG TPA: S41 family peptidase [Fimbriimonadaceae bacterium]|nr:S41 family peptidase [Fimbriimonadaceae bacterium]
MLLVAAALLSLSAPAPAPRLLRYPAVYENRLVFTYGASIWLGDTKGGLARRLTAAGPAGYPYFSPDGKLLAFTGTYDGVADVYVMPAEGGEPKRLTFEPEGDEVVGWTPDGKVAYVTAHGMPMARQPRLKLVDPMGGMPISTPLLEVGNAAFSPDGHEVAYDRIPSNQLNWRRYRGGSQGVISIYNLKTNAYSELPHGEENSWDPLWVGRTIYFESDKKRSTVNLFAYDLDRKKETQLTDYNDSDIKAIRTDGKQIVFERDGYLFDINLATKKVEQLRPDVRSDNVLARPTLKRLAAQITDFSLSPSGNRVAVEARGRIFTVPAHTGEIRAIASTDGVRAKQPDWSPDGKTIAFLSDETGEYQIYTSPQMGVAPGQKPRMYPTSPELKLETLDWMPDSKHLVLTTLDSRLLVLDMESGAAREVAKADPGITSYDYSADSAWIAYVRPETNGFSAVWLYDMKSGKSTRVTEGYYRDDLVAFDRSGKYLYLVSARTVNAIPGDFERGLTTFGAQRLYAILLTKDLKSPFATEPDEEPAGRNDGAGGAISAKRGKPERGKPPTEEGDEGEGDAPTVKIDLDGLGERIVALPMPAGEVAFVTGAEHGLFYSDGENLFRYELGAPEAAPVIEGIHVAVTFNAARTKLAYFVNGVLGIADAHPGMRPFEGRTDLSGLEAVVDPRKEWRQIFWDAWRWERDAFYDPKFTGIDWKAIGNKYAAYLDGVTDRTDLNYVIGLMIGELGTSHAYVAGGDYGPRPAAISVGQLGADYETANGKIRFKKIYRGLSFDEVHRSPLAEPGLNLQEGEYLLEINGMPVPPDQDPSSMLVDKANRSVTLTVNDKPVLEGARRVIVKPLASESDLRYIDWVEANRITVSKLSGGRIGYMHVPDTDAEGIVGFVKGFYSQSDKLALVVDERWNSGGDIPTFFTEKLARTSQAVIKDRYGRDVRVPTEAIEGPKVLLINGYSGSGGDMFAYLFRKQSLGQLIGTRTWGGLVGYMQPYRLVDGGQLTAPQFGLYDPSNGKWIAENHGIDPDIEVDLRPDLVAKGADPQLERAVEVLLEKLKKGEGKKPVKTPTYPSIATSGKN